MEPITCPKHTTGGGPCYCDRPVMRLYTIKTIEGRVFQLVAKGMSDAMRMCKYFIITSVKSEPIKED